MKQYEQMSITDPLTQVFNRRYFNDVISQEINRAKRDKTILCFIILDVDYFKKYNDTYGHIAGDEALIAIANTLKNSLHRAGDYPFRLGGEEFGALFSAVNETNALNFAEQIRKNISDLRIPHSSSEVTNYVTASLGLIVVDFKEQTADKDEFYRLADSALYSAKENGRNQVFLHQNDEMEFF
ncbi:MAG: GGDEF domain-containing protein [Arcobacteraceae bacterium]